MLKKLTASLIIFAIVVAMASDQRIHSNYKRGLFRQLFGDADTSSVVVDSTKGIAARADSLMLFDDTHPDSVSLSQLTVGGSVQDIQFHGAGATFSGGGPTWHDETIDDLKNIDLDSSGAITTDGVNTIAYTPVNNVVRIGDLAGIGNGPEKSTECYYAGYQAGSYIGNASSGTVTRILAMAPYALQYAGFNARNVGNLIGGGFRVGYQIMYNGNYDANYGVLFGYQNFYQAAYKAALFQYFNSIGFAGGDEFGKATTGTIEYIDLYGYQAGLDMCKTAATGNIRYVGAFGYRPLYQYSQATAVSNVWGFGYYPGYGKSGGNKFYLSVEQNDDFMEVWGDSNLIEFKNTLQIPERSTDANEAPEGHAKVWLSDGTEYGDDGDVILSTKVNGVARTIRVSMSVSDTTELKTHNLPLGSKLYLVGLSDSSDVGGGWFSVRATAYQEGAIAFDHPNDNYQWVRDEFIQQGYVNIEWFGGRGDNSTDCADALQRAIDSEYSVFIPAGIFRIYSEITFNNSSPIKLFGINPGADRIGTYEQRSNIQICNPIANAFHLKGNFITIKDLGFNSGYVKLDSLKSVISIYDYGDHATIENVIFDRLDSDSVFSCIKFLPNYVNSVIVRRCWFQGRLLIDYGIDARGSTAFHNQFIDCRFVSMAEAAYICDHSNTSTYFRGCAFEDAKVILNNGRNYRFVETHIEDPPFIYINSSLANLNMSGFYCSGAPDSLIVMNSAAKVSLNNGHITTTAGYYDRAHLPPVTNYERYKHYINLSDIYVTGDGEAFYWNKEIYNNSIPTDNKIWSYLGSTENTKLLLNATRFRTILDTDSLDIIPGTYGIIDSIKTEATHRPTVISDSISNRLAFHFTSGTYLTVGDSLDWSFLNDHSDATVLIMARTGATNNLIDTYDTNNGITIKFLTQELQWELYAGGSLIGSGKEDGSMTYGDYQIMGFTKSSSGDTIFTKFIYDAWTGNGQAGTAELDTIILSAGTYHADLPLLIGQASSSYIDIPFVFIANNVIPEADLRELMYALIIYYNDANHPYTK